MGWTIGALAVSFTQMGLAHLDDLILHRNPIYRDDLGVTCAQAKGSLSELEDPRIFFPIHNRSIRSIQVPLPLTRSL
jgi:hypothetical protein